MPKGHCFGRDGNTGVCGRSNVLHLARHDVMSEEVEEVCHRTPVVQEGNEGRSLVFGPRAAGRMVTVVLDPPEGRCVLHGDRSSGEQKRAGLHTPGNAREAHRYDAREQDGE